MGQQISSCQQCSPDNQERLLPLESFPDLASLPPELAAQVSPPSPLTFTHAHHTPFLSLSQVLSHLDATDLCLASCVNESWWGLANIDPLWKQSVIHTSCFSTLLYLFISSPCLYIR